jgi:hypothetical protein
VGKADIALIHEPWVYLYMGQVRGLTNSGVPTYSVAPGNNARSCICQESYYRLTFAGVLLGMQQW